MLRKTKSSNHDTDRRPEPKPRRYPRLWQAYQMWDDLVQLRKRHLLRLSSIEAGKSSQDAAFERIFIANLELDRNIAESRNAMINCGATNPVWGWLTGFRGLKEGSLAAQLLAQIDDISRCSTVSALWRFAGQAVVNGRAEYDCSGEKSHYNHRLKSICWLIGDEFIKFQTPPYVDIYYAEKERLRALHPAPEPIAGAGDGTWKFRFTPSHLDRMARRKMIKIFLQHLWLLWRQAEGLPVSQPYVQAQLGHADIIPLPNGEHGLQSKPMTALASQTVSPGPQSKTEKEFIP
jgi:hypothetical protein